MTPRKPNPRWPNQRPDIDTADVARRYVAGASTPELARLFDCSARTIVMRLRAAGVELRGQGKFKRLTAGHGWAWKGEAASYSVKHRRVYRLRGQPSLCCTCGRTDDGVAYDWANLTGNYNDPLDYQRMCRPCHRRFDYERTKAAA